MTACLDCGTPTDPYRRALGRCSRCYQSYRKRQTIYGKWEPRLVDGIETRDHLHRLMAAGMSQRAISRAAGFSSNRTVATVLAGNRVRRTTAAAILSIELPTSARETQSAWVDEVLIQRVISGHYRTTQDRKLSPAERRAVLDHALRHGWNSTTLALRLDCTPQAAGRALDRHKKAAA